MSGPLALPPFPNTQVSWGASWGLGVAHPTLTASSFGPNLPDHYRVYRTLVRTFTSPVDVSGPIAGAGIGVGVPFTDTSVSIDGVGYVYWMVGFDAGETHATYANTQSGFFPNAGILVCHNHVVSTGLEITGPAESVGIPVPAVLDFPFTDLPLVTAAVGNCHGNVTITFGTFVPGSPYSPGIAKATAGTVLWPNGWLQLPAAPEIIVDPGSVTSSSGNIVCSIPFGSISSPTSFPGLQVIGTPGVSDLAFQWGVSPTPASSLDVTLDAELVYIEIAAVYNAGPGGGQFTQGHTFG